MRHDARSIGDILREIDEREREERGMDRNPPARGGDPSQKTPKNKPFVTQHDAGDEEQSTR